MHFNIQKVLKQLKVGRRRKTCNIICKKDWIEDIGGIVYVIDVDKEKEDPKNRSLDHTNFYISRRVGKSWPNQNPLFSL